MSSNNEAEMTLKLITNLKSNSKSDVYSSLTSLKKDSKYHKQFVKDGGLSILLEHLNSENLKILDLSLSILANMCLHEYIRQEMRSLNPALKVVDVLKNSKSSSIQCRACRLIGNLSECSWHARALCQYKVVRCITNVLKSAKTSEPTQLMAIRAIRNIWAELESSKEKILELGTFREITRIFILASEKHEKIKQDLVHSCLKAMCAFLQTADPRCAFQLRGENDSQGYKYIIRECQLENDMALKCLYILCQIAECRPILGSEGAIECVLSLIEIGKISWESLACFCLFCREAVNRARIRANAGLELVLGILKQSEHERYHPMLLHAMVQFIYDDPSILIMTKNGLLDVLILNLKQMTEETPEKGTELQIAKKRAAGSPFSKRAEIKFNRSKHGRFSSDYPRDDWSPGSATSMCSSPPSTPPLSAFYEDASDESTEENYSPVCSDTEYAENDEEPENETESAKSTASATTDSLPSELHGKCTKSVTTNQAHLWALTLLSRLSHSIEPVEKLADATTIKPLLAYIRSTKNIRASRILTRIIRNRTYLMTLLKQGFVFEVQTMQDSEQYIRQLCALAETGCALGELASILLRGQETHKIVIAVSIPFLIQSKDALRTLLKTHGGLPLVFRILNDKSHDLHENAVYAICRLANALNIRPAILDRNQTDGLAGADHLKNSEYHLKPSVVTFELDDGTTVDAYRNILCQKSEVFCAMLEGNFSESGKRRVKLKNTTREGLDTLLLAVNGLSYNEQNIESLLDAVLLADKFLMQDVLETLMESSISNLNFGNVFRTWHWARTNSCDELRISCSKIFLTAKSTKAERLKTFEDFSQSDYFSEFINDVKQILVNGLSYH